MVLYVINGQEVEVEDNIAHYHDELIYNVGHVIVPTEDVEVFEKWIKENVIHHVWVNGNEFNSSFEIGRLINP